MSRSPHAPALLRQCNVDRGESGCRGSITGAARDGSRAPGRMLRRFAPEAWSCRRTCLGRSCRQQQSAGSGSSNPLEPRRDTKDDAAATRLLDAVAKIDGFGSRRDVDPGAEERSRPAACIGCALDHGRSHRDGHGQHPARALVLAPSLGFRERAGELDAPGESGFGRCRLRTNRVGRGDAPSREGDEQKDHVAFRTAWRAASAQRTRRATRSRQAPRHQIREKTGEELSVIRPAHRSAHGRKAGAGLGSRNGGGRAPRHRQPRFGYCSGRKRSCADLWPADCSRGARLARRRPTHPASTEARRVRAVSGVFAASLVWQPHGRGRVDRLEIA